jgi:hypothetical protein
MGMALQSAQLFEQTQRLLRETEQRNAELAVINSIQQVVGAALAISHASRRGPSPTASWRCCAPLPIKR